MSSWDNWENHVQCHLGIIGRITCVVFLNLDFLWCKIMTESTTFSFPSLQLTLCVAPWKGSRQSDLNGGVQINLEQKGECRSITLACEGCSRGSKDDPNSYFPTRFHQLNKNINSFNSTLDFIKISGSPDEQNTISDMLTCVEKICSEYVMWSDDENVRTKSNVYQFIGFGKRMQMYPVVYDLAN